MLETDSKILVIYVGVGNIDEHSIPDVVRKISERIVPSTFEGEIIVIPTRSYDTKIECINPRYVTEEELIKENTEMLKRLNEEVQHQLNQIENEKIKDSKEE